MGARLKPQTVAIGLIFLLTLFVAAGASFLFWKSYQDTKGAVRNQAASASGVVSANVAWAFETARQVLARVDDSLGDDLASLGPDASARLADAISTVPGAVKVYVVDASGATRLTTDRDGKPIDAADREYLTAVADGEPWHTTTLLVDRTTGQQFFAISKRIERNGVFAGAAVITFSSDFMKGVWQSLNLDEFSTVGLFRDDGQLVSRYPIPDGPLDLSKYVLFTDYLPKAPDGVYEAVSPVDTVDRIVAYRRVPGTDLVAISSLSTAAAFAAFTSTTEDLLWIAVPAILALLAIALWTFRLLRIDGVRRQSEAQFQVFAEAMPNHVWTARPDGMLDWFNRRVFEYSGLPEADLTGAGWLKIVHPNDAAPAGRKWALALATGEPYETEFRLLRHDGVFRWHLARAVTIRDAKGAIRSWIGTNTDIEDAKQAAQALAQSEARLRLAIDAGQLAVWEVDVTTRRVTTSAALNRLYGFPADSEPTLEQYQARYAPGEVERVGKIAAQAMARGDAEFEVEVRHVWPDGTERWLLIRAQVTPVAGSLGERAIGVVIDITDRKRVEQELTASERRFRLSQRAAGIASLELDVASGAVFGSERFWELWGLPPRDSVHISVLENIVVPDDAEIRSTPETRKAGTAVPSVEYRIRRPDTGELRWLARHIEFVHDEAGTPTKMFGVMRDVTEQKEAETRQRTLTHELQHRIKNILAMVSALASQSLRNTDLESARAAFSERLVALSNAHDILTDTHWTEASIVNVMRASLAPLPAEQIAAAGPDIALPPRMALSLALAVHELGTNAVKYGALSADAGRVRVAWSIEAAADGAHTLVWTWQESGGPTVSPPAKRGFGSTLIERVLAADFSGAVRMDYPPEGVQCTLTAPMPDSGNALN